MNQKTQFQKMRANRAKLVKATEIIERRRDVDDADPMSLYQSDDGRMDALNHFVAGGGRLTNDLWPIHGGKEVVLSIDGKTFKYSGREYNIAVSANNKMKAMKVEVDQPTKPRRWWQWSNTTERS